MNSIDGGVGRRQNTALRLTAWLGTLAVIPFVELIADLRTRLSGIARDVMLFGAIGFVVETIVWSWFHVGLALHAATLAPATARALDDIGAYYGPVLTATMVLFIAPLGIAAWQGTAGLPKWFAWVTAVFAAEQLVETITIFGKEGFIAPGGSMNFQLGAGLFFGVGLGIWIRSVSHSAGRLTSDCQARSIGYVTSISAIDLRKSLRLLVMKRSAPAFTAVARCTASAARSE